MAFRLLDAFRGLFSGQAYHHRNSTLGDFVAMHLFEDLRGFDLSPKFTARVDAASVVLNVENRQQGIRARRGDGTLGQLVPGATAIADPSFVVRRGPVAQLQVGAEVKILQKAMIKQIDRVISDLAGQAATFRQRSPNAICVAVVGVNRADYSVGYEGEQRPTRTDGKKHKHPIAEAAEAEKRLRDRAAPHYDEFVVLRYAATNDPPFPFAWHNGQGAQLDYGAALQRVANLYEARF